MTTPTFNYFYRVEVTVVRLGDQIESGTQTVRTKVTKTYNFVNKSIRDATTPSDRETMWPILESIGEVTINSGEFIPSTSFSSISIQNHRGSFGADRKFSDVLERYTIIDQAVTFYIGQSDNFSDAPITWTQMASGQVVSWNVSLNSQEPTLDFQIAPYKISDRVMNLEVSRDVHGMENAPDGSIGVALPLVLNKIHGNLSNLLSSYPQVVPIRISADGSESAKYALCTLMYQHTKANVMTNYYAKKSWETDADAWSAISFTRAADSYLGAQASDDTLNRYSSIAYRIPEHAAGSNASGFVVTGVTLTLKGGGNASSNAQLSAYILRVERDTYSVIDEVARGKQALATYNAQNVTAGSTFNVNISFNSPVVIDLMSDRAYDFYIGYEVTNYVANDASIYIHPTTTRAIGKVAGGSQTAADSTNDWKIISTSTGIPAHRLRTVTATANVHEDSYTRDGHTYASLTLSQSAPDTGQVNPPLESLNIVALVEGLFNYTFGYRESEPHVVLLYYSSEWNGESWVDANAVDWTTLNESHYRKLYSNWSDQTYRSRYITGVITSKVSYSQVITEIARGTASKIGIFSSKKLFLYPWGVTVTPAFNIPQADIIPLSWETRDPSSIINRISLTFNRVYAIEGSMEVEGGYAYSIDFSNPDYLAVQQITEESRALYGTKNIVENKFDVFGYSDYYANVGVPGYLTGGPSSSQPQEGGVVTFSVDFLAEYYMTRYALPAVYCSFVIPWHRYNTIRLFDVINFSHSEFPAFYGTDPSAQPGVVVSGSNTTAIPNANYGQEFTRAQTYRGLVEGISYVMAMEHAPAIRLTVLVLLNREFDPT